MVLVTGPTGSGKTTTLYAALNEIKNDEDKLITIEDPVEYQIKGITQIPVNEKKGLTFARGCAPSCAMTRTRSWSAKSATPKPRRSPSSPRSPDTWCSPPSTPTTWSTLSAASSTWVSSLQLRLRVELHPRAAAGAYYLRALQNPCEILRRTTARPAD